MSTGVHPAGDDLSGDFPTLGQLRRRILADEALPGPRRRDMASALASLARALGRPPELIAADPVSLRPALAGLTPAMAGHKPGRWRNILSLTTAALAHAGIVCIQGRIRDRPSPAWCAILGLLGPGIHRHFYLWRFARWATGHGIGPMQVDDGLLARYRHELETRSLVTEPARAARDTARHWNMAATAHPGWPQQRLTVPDNRNRYSLPWEAFPESLRRDVEDWRNWLGADDPFMERDFAALRPPSVAARLRQLRLYLAALVHGGVDPQALDSLAAAVTPARAELGLRFFWQKAGCRPSQHAYHIASLVMMIARHRAQLPAADLDRLRAMADRLRPAAHGLSDRNRSRLRQLEDPRRLDALLTLPARILERVRRAGAPGIQLARELQNAVAIELLICIPMRLRNLRELRVGIHLHRGPGGRMWVTIPGEEVKNGVPLEGELPADSARLVALYLDRYRPLLASAGGDWLFPGAGAGAPKSDDGLRSSIAKAIATDCGLRFNPHLFRHTAAWLILRDNPAAHGQVQRVLGHKSLGSTMAFYSGLEGPAALQAYDRLIAGHREAPGPAGPRGRRPRRAS